MKYGFNVYQMENEGKIFWVAESKDLNGCAGQGDTLEEAVRELEDNEKIWLETADEYEIPIPVCSIERYESCSGKFTVRISKHQHQLAKDNAKKEGISFNNYVNNAIVAANSKVSLLEQIAEGFAEIKNHIDKNHTVISEYSMANSNATYSKKVKGNIVQFVDLKQGVQ